MLEDEKFQLGAWVNIHTQTPAGMGVRNIFFGCESSPISPNVHSSVSQLVR